MIDFSWTVIGFHVCDGAVVGFWAVTRERRSAESTTKAISTERNASCDCNKAVRN